MKKAIAIVMMFLIFGAMATPASAQHCDVRNGDSMWRIAKRYHVLFHDVLRLNQHFKDQNMIHPNDEIELPDGNTGETTNQSHDGSGDSSETPDRSEITDQAKQVLNLVNQERAKQNLPALTLNQKLTNVATIKAKDMRDNKYFDHQSPTYGSPFDMMKKFGVSYSYAGENIAAGQKTASDVMNSWMNSSGHRANILNKNYTQIGIGYVTGGSYGTYWVQQFIKP